MKYTPYLVAATTTIAVASASPHPAYQQQQHLGTTPSLSQPEIVVNHDPTSPEDIINASPLLSFHRDLVQIESISGNEHDVGIFVTQFLEAHNFTVIKQVVAPVEKNEDDDAVPKTRYNIYAYPAAQTSPPSILLTSHIDTVPPFIPYSVHQPQTSSSSAIDPEKLIVGGRGSVDAKASVAAQVFAALETLAQHPSAGLGLLFVVGEELGGGGMKTFSDSQLNNQTKDGFRTVIFGEPTNLALVSGHKGMMGFKVIVEGQAAHSGYPWLGHSAVSAILPALMKVDELGKIGVEHGGLPSSPKYGPTTLNIGVVRAGVATNVVPAHAIADVAVRLAAGTPGEARKIIANAVADATRHTGANVTVDFSSHGLYPPQDLDTDVEGFDVTAVNYGTDVPNLSVAKGTKRYLYGPGSIFVAHGDNEALSVHHITEAVEGYKKLIAAAISRSDAKSEESG
ncbi:Peptidase M20 [Penicillium riverlandense]|uniref:Peptidase M20 n=1 Tax=Penicillium riverlandense TaxID=1903569 RepID=UPI002546AB1A|nr:Peptidase M20 [Penicillium riverlandense]KAJ5818349.1 Peptidase M20 [Penicillium riverlandense]